MTSTIVSWALTLSLIGAAVYYYKPGFATKATSSSVSTPSSHLEPAERPPNKRIRSKKNQSTKVQNNDSTPSSSNEIQSGKKRKIVNTSEAGTSTPNNTGKDDADSADKEFAQQLAKAQAGTKLQKSGDQNATKRNKAPAQTHNAAFESSDFSTGTSSTAGRDADDDLTPADSPQLLPRSEPSKAGDISDMLEAPAAKPTTLRLTGIPDEVKPKKKSAAQPFEQVLSKKQRQAQAKKEELRQMKEESDRIHEAKKQEQLRRARMASGTSNQTKANTFASTNHNAWQSNKSNDLVKAAPSASAAPLLDTFEPSKNNVSQPHGAVHTTSLTSVNANDATELRREIGDTRVAAAAASTREGLQQNGYSLAGNISEEDQMKMLKEQQAEDAWESVTSKKSKKKPKVEGNDTPAAKGPTASKIDMNGSKPNKGQSHAEPETNNRFGSFQDPRSDKLIDAEWEA